jgi:hypothetical protein
VPKPYTFQEEDIVNDDWGQDDEGLGVEGEHVAEFAPPEVEYDVDAEVSSNPKPQTRNRDFAPPEIEYYMLKCPQILNVNSHRPWILEHSP